MAPTAARQKLIDAVRDYALGQAFHDDAHRANWEYVHHEMGDWEIDLTIGKARKANTAQAAMTAYVHSFH
ncbi:hypothetical protein [Amycolatopsis sp. DSM 110486]|uniref:hypothetical protein n=1 Tax=Amycolatopsis sp. DSM 110486 TaxID=2865832 RepID=UPI001C69BED2|nr:hypothetical protein [Amycolatopsis sp. DSM 110486]QYN17487.1 hypothetical protein K1T34_32395 [Amycolatopsis sp. DSM 110486]